MTKDNVNLRCTWYAPIKPGKNVVPIIMIHGLEGRRQEYDWLASFLQAAGHAVIVPDLRGHGDSTTFKGVPASDARIEGDAVIQDRRKTRFKPDVYLADVEACKSFLMDKNNEGELNIELLTVVGAETGALIALNWAMQDWSWPQLPTLKQGQDVKALVLLSPEWSQKGMTASKSLAFPPVQKGLSVMVAVGIQDRAAYSDAKRIYGALEKAHDEPPRDADREEILRKKDLYFIEADTEINGTRLVDRRLGLKVDENVRTFVFLRLVKKEADFAWSDRTNPLSSE